MFIGPLVFAMVTAFLEFSTESLLGSGDSSRRSVPPPPAARSSSPRAQNYSVGSLKLACRDESRRTPLEAHALKDRRCVAAADLGLWCRCKESHSDIRRLPQGHGLSCFCRWAMALFADVFRRTETGNNLDWAGPVDRWPGGD